MINSKKKGFTIVELVIVIAVIAVLAAVLIPTFSNLVRKAQEAADLQLAKNLNTALTMAEAEGKEIAEFSDVLEVLYEEGYVVANLNPTAEDNWYAWDESSNQILYLNSKFEILYQARDAGGKEKWIIGVGTSEDRDTVLAAQIKAYFTPNNTNDLNDYLGEVLEQIDNGTLTGEQKIIFGGNVDFDNDPLYEINSSAADLMFDLAGSTLGGTYIHNVAPLSIKAGNFTLKNGTFSAEGYFDSTGTISQISASVQYGEKGENVAGGMLTVDNMVFDTNGTAIRIYQGNGLVSNSTINAVNGQSVYVGGSNVIIRDITASVKNYDNIFVSRWVGTDSNGQNIYRDTKLTIESGTYNMYSDISHDYNINCVNGAQVEIKDGIFGSYNAEGEYTNKMFNIDNGTITITGGIFNGKLFSSLTQAQWKALCGVEESDSSINVNLTTAGKVVISK